MILFEAWRDGDEIPDEPIPRGRADSSGAKHQTQRARLLHRRRTQYFTSIGRPEDGPEFEQCFSSRDPRRHMRQVLRAMIAFNRLFVHRISPHDVSLCHQILESLCCEYVRMNCHLPPNFHQLLHLEEFILANGSLYNTHTWPFERANHELTRINNNGHGDGVLEGTMMQGWWTNSQVQGLVRTIHFFFHLSNIRGRYKGCKRFPTVLSTMTPQ